MRGPKGQNAIIHAAVLLVLPLLLSGIQSSFSLFVYRDGLLIHYPIKLLYAKQIFSGIVPYWNPAASFGQPLLANPNTLPLYPGNIGYLILPFDWAYNFHFWVHWIAGSYGVFHLLKFLGRDKTIAVMGSIWWAGSGFILSLFTFYNLIASVAWIPWIVLSFLYLLSNPTFRNATMLGLAAGMQLLTGEPVVIASTVILIITFLCASWKAINRRVVLLIILASVVSIVCAAPQIAASNEVYSYTSRAMVEHSYSRATMASMELQRICEWAVPYIWGIPFEKAPELFRGRAFAEMPFLIPSLHLSFLLLNGLFFGILRNPRILVAGLLILFLFVLGQYGFLWKALFHYVPGFDHLRFPSKFFGAFLLLAIVLSTGGYQKNLSKFRSRHLLGFILFWLSVSIYAFVYPVGDSFFLKQYMIASIVFVLMLVVFLKAPRFLLILAICEAGIGARYLWFGIEKSQLQSPSYEAGTRTFLDPDVVPEVALSTSLESYYSEQTRVGRPMWGANSGFQYAFDEDHDGLYSFYNDYLKVNIHSLQPDKQFAVLASLGVNQIISSTEIDAPGWIKTRVEDHFVYNYPGLPAFYPSAAPATTAGPRETLSGLISGEGPFLRWDRREKDPWTLPDNLTYLELSPSEFHIRLKSNGPTFIIGRITYFPRWRATGTFEDGRSQKLWINQVNLTFTGIEVPAGVRSIHMHFDSVITPFILALWFLTMLILAVFAFTARSAIKQYAENF